MRKMNKWHGFITICVLGRSEIISLRSEKRPPIQGHIVIRSEVVSLF